LEKQMGMLLLLVLLLSMSGATAHPRISHNNNKEERRMAERDYADTSALITDCGCPNSCTDDILDSIAIDATGSFSCRSRMEYLVLTYGFSEVSACNVVSLEFSSVCGFTECDSLVCLSTSSMETESYNVTDTLSPTITPAPVPVAITTGAPIATPYPTSPRVPAPVATLSPSLTLTTGTVSTPLPTTLKPSTTLITTTAAPTNKPTSRQTTLKPTWRVSKRWKTEGKLARVCFCLLEPCFSLYFLISFHYLANHTTSDASANPTPIDSSTDPASIDASAHRQAYKTTDEATHPISHHTSSHHEYSRWRWRQWCRR
jgi:hypothetical protein